MLFTRSLLFYIAFYLNNVLQVLFFLIPFFLTGPKTGYKIANFWARSNIKLHEWIVGARLELRGVENLTSGGLLVACKHQSSHETLSLFSSFNHPAYIMKRSLTKIPILGAYFLRLDQIPVDRGRKGEALASMTKGVRKALGRGCQVLIFPEGTRQRLDAEPNYKYGIQHLYKTLDQPVLPVATNTGAFWPKDGFVHYPGTVVLEFLPIIEPGLDPDEFQVQLIHAIETASDKLLEEAASGPRPSPLAVKAIAARANAKVEPNPSTGGSDLSDSVGNPL
ncbi:MAG: lysophospholipid acyltransferase family protein [Pseudomonadota bacterium]